MSMASTAHLQSSAIVDFVRTGTYPEDTNGTLSIGLHTSAVSNTREILSQAKREVQLDIKTISQQVAPDVDGWIERAKQLQADIEQSRIIARHVVEEAEQAQKARERKTDVAKKAELLTAEATLHSDLENTLRRMQDAKIALSNGKKAVSERSVFHAYDTLKSLEGMLPTFGAVEKTNAFELVHQRIQDLKERIVEQARELLRSSISVERTKRQLSVRRDIQTGAGQDAVSLSFSLGLLREEMRRLSKEIEIAIIGPVLAHETMSTCSNYVETASDTLVVLATDAQAAHDNVIQNIVRIMTFIKAKIPSPADELLGEMVTPFVIAHLVSQRLPAALPTSPVDGDQVQKLMSQVRDLANVLDPSWAGSEELQRWVDNIPKSWLAKRRDYAIDVVRHLVSERLNERKTIEHVETQVVSADDVIIQKEAVQADEWDEHWGDNAEEEHAHKQAESQPEVHGEGEEDWGAWDADESESTTTHINGASRVKSPTGENEGEGWDDWDEQKPKSSSPSPAKPSKDSDVNGGGTSYEQSTREITLRETYTTTALPDELYSTITTLIADAENLRQPPSSFSPIASAAPALYTIPTIALSAFRSLAPPAYELIQGGNMLLFNDSTRLSSRLTSLQRNLIEASDPSVSRLKLGADIPELEAFGRRNYGKAMEEQRIILRDLTDNAQGFTDCTAQPHKSACDDAIAMTVAHVRSTAELWSSILSRNVWLQAIGSLLSTVIGKMVNEIEELSDIGADESTQLKTYVMQVSELKDLFVQDGREAVGLYVKDWFKFQYLAEVLDSNMQEIMFYWKEGGLKSEFDVEEITDLMEALFADGDRRRRAIAEIRKD